MSDIEADFRLFHYRNPNVYTELVALTRTAQLKGRQKIGIGMLFEVLRWNRMLITLDGESPFKLNNNYRSRYARLIMEQEPRLSGMFNLRDLHS